MTNPESPSVSTTGPLQAEVKDRFGVLPNFFSLGGDAPEITANLWGFAQFGYLDNPLPSLFKERLFVYLSRFCDVRYCIARHVGFLVGLGRPAGDRTALPETVDQVIRLIRRPLPRGDALESHLALLEADAAPLPRPPASGTPAEEAVFSCATHVFLQTPEAPKCLTVLRRAFDGAMFQHLMVFLTFVRTAHYWTKVHPELGLEDDVKQLFVAHEALAECVLNDPEASVCEMTQVILDELHSLRNERGRREEMERALEKQRVDSHLSMIALRRDADTQLRDSETRFRTVLGAAPIGVCVCDRGGVIQYFNARAAELWGRTPALGVERYCGSTRLWLRSGARLPHEESPIAEAMRSGSPVRDAEVWIERRDGSRLPVLTTSAALENERGEITGAISCFQDMTERKEAERDREGFLAIAEHARAEAEKANQVKDEFLAMLSHELRSPMNAMLGWIRILKTAGAQDTDLVRRAVETLERNIGIQAQVVNDLLDVSRILSGKLQLDLERVELTSLVAGCVQSLRPAAEGKQTALRLTVKSDELEVLGDGARLQQVVANLLGNAIKFTNTGDVITVTVERNGASASLVIEDTGRGIAADFLPHLFERFRQADTGSTRTHGGLGLGLSIVKSIVALHGGEVEADSAGLGRGARFSVVLPLADVPQRMAFRTFPAKPTVDDGTLGTLDVLLVEDDTDTREALELLLQEHGSRVRSAASVRQALEAYSAQPPDVVISDVGMPGEDGYVLIRAIRDQEEGRSHRTLAIAMTGFAGREDHEMAIRAGFDEHVAKPVEPDALLDRVRVLAASREAIRNRTA